jgi:peptidyl-prolyl cis-trans isomerase SurA
LKKNYISTDEEQEKKLDNFKNLIIDGLDFNEAVKLYSEDQTQINPKNLDWINYDNLLPEFRNQLGNYPEKKLIGPFKTDLGWHLIKVYDFRNNDISDDASRGLTKITLARKKTELRYIDWLDALKKNSSIKFIKND